MRPYPIVPVKPVTDTCFGKTIEDPYRYLEDPASAQTLAVVQAENEYSAAFFAEKAPALTAQLEAALRARKPLTDLSGVSEANGMICAARELPGGIHDIVKLREDMSVDHVIVDEAMLGGRMHVFAASPCPGAPDLYAVTGLIHGHPRCCCLLWDDKAKRELAVLDDNFGFTWSRDGSAILYSEAKVDTAHNTNRNTVCRYDRRSGEKQALYTYPDNAVFIDVQEGPGGGLLLSALNTYVDFSMLWLAPDGSLTRLNDGKHVWRYAGTREGRCFFVTDAGAPFSRIVSIAQAELTCPGALLEKAVTVVPEQDCLIDAALLVREGILVIGERDACAEWTLFSLQGERLRAVPLPDRFGKAAIPTEPLADDCRRVFFRFESFTRQASLFTLDPQTLAIACVKGDEADTGDIAVEQVFLPARDGQRILAYVVRQRDADGSPVPALMYGYGGYAASSNPWAIEPITGTDIVDWVRRGRIYVHAIIRGGSEYGTAWHEAAMFANKKNAFYDFIDIAEHLIATGRTTPALLTAVGCSNGGLLMTAVTTLRPDLFGTVIASVPHTDMLRFRYDDRGMMYITEYGDPMADEAMFDYMLSYSPYHNIRPGTVYPWIYVQTGERDNNVPPYHGKKFGVRLQAAADPRNPVLLTVLATGAHDRGVGDEYYMNVSRIQAFIELGLEARRKQ